MNVSARHMAAAALALVWTGGGAAQEGPCCTGGQQVVTAPSVSVAGPSVSVGTPSVSTTIHHGSTSVHWSRRDHRRGGGQVIIAGGGGSRCCGAGGPAPATVNNLTVVGETVSYETRTHEVRELAAVRAVCLDADGNPHPASRPSPEARVAADFDGEIYRCMAGTSMQATIGRAAEGAPDYAGGETIVCAAGEALRYADGALACAAQEPRRNCHERSLLRRYGPGETLVELVRIQRTEVPVATAFEHAGGPIVFDGGVGAGAACGGC